MEGEVVLTTVQLYEIKMHCCVHRGIPHGLGARTKKYCNFSLAMDSCMCEVLSLYLEHLNALT